jgi:hypothetical protein
MAKCTLRCTVVEPRGLRYAFVPWSLSQTDRPEDVVRLFEHMLYSISYLRMQPLQFVGTSLEELQLNWKVTDVRNFGRTVLNYVSIFALLSLRRISHWKGIAERALGNVSDQVLDRSLSVIRRHGMCLCRLNDAVMSSEI